MPTKTSVSPALRVAESPLLWTGLARAHVEAMTSGAAPRRALVSGPSGSGKSRLLRHLRRSLAEIGATVVSARGHHDLAAVPADDVLVVDDAHLLAGDQLAAIGRRAADADSALILAARPWPHGDALHAAIVELERAQPAIVLGHVARADLTAHLDAHGERISAGCVDGMLEVTGGASWLVAESLAIHDFAGCSDDPRHEALHDALQDVIAHRLRAVDASVRNLVETLCLSGDSAAAPEDAGLVLAAYAEGLLLANGRPVPLVRSAVHATTPVDRVIELYDAGAQDAVSSASFRSLMTGIRNPRLADALLRHGDAVRSSDPRRAGELYSGASDSGADPTVIAIRRARVEWSLGNVDAASAHLDSTDVEADHPDHDAAADTAAAIWSARGLTSMSDAVYRSFAPSSIASRTRAAIAALAAADPEPLRAALPESSARTMPSTLSVSMQLLDRGMRETLTGSGQSALNDLVRASEMYSASRADDPTPELPAVIAALAALNLGEPEVAHSVLDRAVEDGHGGAWAHDRLVLWRAWVALQQERAHEVEAAIESILPTARALTPRDRLLFDALSIAIARRYHDTTALAAAWRGARESLLRARFDVFGLLPMGEFVVTAARVGESDRMRSHFGSALDQLGRLGSPPLWSAQVHWTGIQQAILLGRPDDLPPHARALLEAAPHNRLAATMAQAGRVWTSVLAGSVDADAVESAALALGTVGLAWDGARLAGHGAGRTDDRRVISRLLATARRLHPHEDVRPAAVESDPAQAPRPRSHEELSPRELEVAALVVQGKTYAEIGASIFISPRTAEHHIARIRRRLGATTRSDLISKLRMALEDSTDSAEAGSAHARASA
ncbi:helix-turn-helix transcriptional regulator [Planococcus sp. APC 4015]|nr:helix-turn-helix transcriptional regulator [Planococcus sp. APC 4015]